METGNGKWKWNWKLKWKCTNCWRGIAHGQGRYCARHRVLRGDGTVCGQMEEGTEGFVVITCVLL